jgi:lysophospholipase L1-like esterase
MKRIWMDAPVLLKECKEAGIVSSKTVVGHSARSFAAEWIWLVLFAGLLSCSEGLFDVSTRQVAAWGDSITYGYGALAGEDYPSQLSKLLKRSVYNGGINGETSSDIYMRIAGDSAHRHDVVILWMGRNNPQYPDTVISDVEAAVRVIFPNQRFLILSVLNRSWEVRGTPEYANLIALNDALQSRYPRNYVDMREYLVTQYDASLPSDVMLHNQDAVPLSLRSDEIHPNAKGYHAIAAKLAKEIESRGW